MSALERGFKSWCERLAEGIRRDLELAPHDPLQPDALAAYLDVRLLHPEQIPGISPAVLRQLLENDPWGWSAVTQVVAGAVTVIYNPRHSAGRRSSNIAHELAHVLLEHDASRIILSPNGQVAMRSFDAKQEDEAGWLSGCLLLPRVGLLRAFRAGRSIESIAASFGVTEALVAYRSRITGVEAQVRRGGSGGKTRPLAGRAGD